MDKKEMQHKIEEMEKTMRWLKSMVQVHDTILLHSFQNRFIPFTLHPFYTFKDGTVIGDLMTTREFFENVVSGAFIDYDGYGRFATKDQVSDITVTPSIFERLVPYIDPCLTHIIWFNK